MNEGLQTTQLKLFRCLGIIPSCFESSAKTCTLNSVESDHKLKFEHSFNMDSVTVSTTASHDQSEGLLVTLSNDFMMLSNISRKCEMHQYAAAIVFCTMIAALLHKIRTGALGDCQRTCTLYS